MSNAEVAYITPEVVSWAISRSGLTYAKISASLEVSQDQIRAWEHGRALPSFSKAIHLAEVLRVPFGYFYLDSPPNVEVPLPDFRTRLSTDSREPSVDFLELLYSALSKQEWYREYAQEHDAGKLPFVASFTIRGSPNRVADDIRRTLGINNALRQQADSYDDYLSLLSSRAETAGILVMRSGVVGNDPTRPLSVDEFQGFTISDEIAPLIFVNSRDFKAPQIFTLAHELAHVWIGRGGISKPDETDVAERQGRADESKVELFCNAVAAEVLVPESEFHRAWQSHAQPIPLQPLARRFRVSSVVILRRAYELNIINRNQFFGLLKQERENQTTKKPSRGGDYYRNVRARHSSKFIEVLLSDVRQGRTAYRDAARLVDMKVPTLVKLIEKAK